MNKKLNTALDTLKLRGRNKKLFLCTKCPVCKTEFRYKVNSIKDIPAQIDNNCVACKTCDNKTQQK